MSQRSDGVLLEAHKRGERGAFEELVRLHEEPLLQHARSILGSGASYEDAVQDTFLKLAQSPPTLPEEVRGDAPLERAHLASWLHTVTRNHCMDTMRSESRRKRREHNAAGHEASDGGIGRVEEDDTRAAVRRVLDCLPTDQREVLVLRLVNERSYKEIAEITGKKIGTIGWLVSVGLKELAGRLEPLLALESSRNTRPAASSQLGTVRGEVG